eukprot:256872-Chlamydomonas_euryale.AAC.1
MCTPPVCMCTPPVCMCNPPVCMCNPPVWMCTPLVYMCIPPVCMCNPPVCMCTPPVWMCTLLVCMCTPPVCMCNPPVCMCNPSPKARRALSLCIYASAPRVPAAVRGRGVNVRPRYSIKRTEKPGGDWHVEEVKLPDTTSSFHTFQVEQVVADIK